MRRDRAGKRRVEVFLDDNGSERLDIIQTHKRSSASEVGSAALAYLFRDIAPELIEELEAKKKRILELKPSPKEIEELENTLGVELPDDPDADES